MNEDPRENQRDGPLADKNVVRKKGLEQRLNRRVELEDVGVMLSTRAGRRFFNRLLVAGNMFAPIFYGNNTTFARAAEHDVMLPFLADAQNFPDLYLLMLKESREPEELEKEKGPRMLEKVPVTMDE